MKDAPLGSRIPGADIAWVIEGHGFKVDIADIDGVNDAPVLDVPMSRSSNLLPILYCGARNGHARSPGTHPGRRDMHHVRVNDGAGADVALTLPEERSIGQ
jgi:hypothetical protein|nr:hypothetical protein [Caballeronia arationis]